MQDTYGIIAYLIESMMIAAAKKAYAHLVGLRYPPPHARQPRLLLSRQPLGTIEMREFGEACIQHVSPPARQTVRHTITVASLSPPPLLVIAARIRTEQHAP